MGSPTKQDVLNLGTVIQGLVARLGQDLAFQGYRSELDKAQQDSLIPASVRVKIPGQQDASASFVPGPGAQYSGTDQAGYLRRLVGLMAQGNPLATRAIQGEVMYKNLTKPDYLYTKSEEGLLQTNKATGQTANVFPFLKKPALTPFQEESLKLRRDQLGRGDATNIREVAKSRGRLKDAISVVQSFESNPELVSGYQKIIKDPQVVEATKAGDVDLAQSIMARLLGDTTPQRILTKRYTDYINAKGDIEKETEFLNRMGEKNVPFIPKAKKQSEVINY